MRFSGPVLWLLYLNRQPGVVLLPLFIVGGGLFMTMSIWIMGPSAWLLFAGVQTDATATGKQLVAVQPVDAPPPAIFAHGGKLGPRWRIAIEFLDPAGNPHTGTVSMNRGAGDALRPGDTVRIRYLPENPARVELASSWWVVFPLVLFFGIGALMTTAGLVVFCGELREVTRRVRLIRSGTAVPGRVANAYVEYRGKRRSERYAIIQYEYATPRTDTAEPELRNSTLELGGKLPKGFESGMGIVVLLDPDDPAVSTPDVFDARRDDRMRLLG